MIYAWNGTTLVSVLQVTDATQGTWSKQDQSVTVEYAVYLYGEPNCCPCNRQKDRYDWNGNMFVAARVRRTRLIRAQRQRNAPPRVGWRRLIRASSGNLSSRLSRSSSSPTHNASYVSPAASN